jgi:hypothetical protein
MTTIETPSAAPTCFAVPSDEQVAQWFNEKYPHATCHDCNEALNGDTVVYCGNDCETWYCDNCHEVRETTGETWCCEECQNYEDQHEEEEEEGDE